MSNQTPNPNPNPTPNAATQAAAAQAAAQAVHAANANSQAALAGESELEEVSPAENDEQLAEAWGFASRRPRLSKEAVIGVIAIIALLAMFSYFVAQHFNNRAAVASKSEESDKPGQVDPKIKPASNTDPLESAQSNVGGTLDEFEEKAAKKGAKKGVELEEELLDIGAGQSEPEPSRVATRRPQMPVNLDEEFDTVADSPRTAPPVRGKPKEPEESPDFSDQPTTARTNRPTATREVELSFEPEQPALTKTTEPIRLQQPVENEPADEEFKKPLRTNPAQQIEDEFEIVPQRAQRTRQPVRVAQQERFTEKTGFDEPDTRTSPTTDLPPARERTDSPPAREQTEVPTTRQRTAAKPAARHPLLQPGETLVEEGDNFCVISKRLYGSEKYFMALAEHNRNRVADPCRMRPGLIILTPTLDVLEQQHSALIPKAKPAVEAKGEKSHATQKVSAAPLPPGLFQDEHGAVWYRVGKGDTLTGIAQAHLGRISRADQIYALNRERLRNRNDLRLGQELRLPNDASQVSLDESEKSRR
ncbi:MAG: LysM peptidoglycan-binding domain-containing protein [Planctomycetaceae bacterium]